MTETKPLSRRATRRTAAKKITSDHDPFAPPGAKKSDDSSNSTRPKTSIYTQGFVPDKAMIEKPEFLLPPGDSQNPLSLWAMMLNPSEKKLFVPEVPLSKIKAREGESRQVREEFNSESLDQMAKTIKDMGLMKPPELTYDADEDTFWIETGERRVRSCRIAELENIPAFVFLVRPKNPIVRQLTENIQAEGLSAFETLDSLIRIQDELKADGLDASYASLARVIQKPRSYVQKHFNLESINVELRELVKQYELVTDFQYMDYLRKIWDISSDIVHFMLKHRKDYGFNRSFAMLLLKGLKSQYANEIETSFRNFSLVKAEQIESALRYFSLDGADPELVISAGPASSVRDEGYIERLIYEHESKPIGVQSLAHGKQNEVNSEIDSSNVKVETPVDSPLNPGGSKTDDKNTNIDDSELNPDNKVEDDSSVSIVNAEQRVISGQLKGIGNAFLDLTRKDTDSTYAWFLTENKELIRAKVKHFSIKMIS